MAEEQNGVGGQGLSRRIRGGDEMASARADVELSRTRLTTTADKLQEKLEPQNLRAEAKDLATSAARNAGKELLAAIKRNPLPSVAAGAVALGLLVIRIRRRH